MATKKIDMDVKSREKVVKVIEYILAKNGGSSCTVEELLQKFNITFEEYRVCSDLAMPALRQYTDAVGNARRASYYKGVAKKLAARLRKLTGEPVTVEEEKSNEDH